jgi:transcriptional regulator with XRE-family HTH domain
MAFKALREADQATSPGDDPPPVNRPGGASGPIGGRVRELRKALGLTLGELSSQVGISISYLSQIERDVSRLPIGVLQRISDVLGVHINWFFHGGSPGPADERDIVVRAGDRRVLTFTGLGITEELLSPNLAGPLELLISTIDPGADSEFYAHDGAEAGVVLNGTIDLWIGDRHVTLHPGDSFAFPSSTKHRCANPGGTPAKVLWVVTPPHY